MRTPLDDMEAELRQLQPSRPSELLAARVEQGIAAERDAQRRRRWLLSLASAAAVTLALLPFLRPATELPAEPVTNPTPAVPSESEVANRLAPAPPPERAPSEDTSFEGLTRLASANWLCGAEEDGIVFASSTTPFRRIRYQYLDTTDWRDEKAQAVIRVVVPREDVVLMPLEVY